jgi:hypothetical protein
LARCDKRDLLRSGDIGEGGMLAILLLLLGQEAQGSRVDTALASYRAQTRAAIPCATSRDNEEITVCALRTADRYRVTFVDIPDRDNVPRERAAVMDRGLRDCGVVSAFWTDCSGMVGVSATVGADGVVHRRKLAP